MKFQFAIANLAAVVLASACFDSASSFVPTSLTRASHAASLQTDQSLYTNGRHNTQIHVASSEIVTEADVKPRKTREVRDEKLRRRFSQFLRIPPLLSPTAKC